MIVAWQGLGYNRRAVSLHRAARVVAARGWPDDLTELPGVGPYTAAAVGNFAFGRDVLPVDTNVRRIQERTGDAFDGSCAQALFDLGATICLARIPRCGVCPLAARCPSRGSRYEPLRKQSAFEGSFRQRRAIALRAVAAGEQPADGDALVSLARDGLVVLRRTGEPHCRSVTARELGSRGTRRARSGASRTTNLAGSAGSSVTRPSTPRSIELRHAAHVADRPRHDSHAAAACGDSMSSRVTRSCRGPIVRATVESRVRLVEEKRRREGRARSSRELGEYHGSENEQSRIRPR